MSLARFRRAHLVLAHDLTQAVLAFVVAVHISYWEHGVAALLVPEALALGTLVFAAAAAATFYATGLYRGVWRYASMNDAFGIIRAVTIADLATLGILFVLSRGEALPRSALVYAWGIAVLLLILPRAVYRVWKDGGFGLLFRRMNPGQVPVLLVGAVDQAEQYIRACLRDPQAAHRPVGILDRKDRRVGQSIRGVPILGDIGDLGQAVARLEHRSERPQRLVVCGDRIGPADLKALLDEAERLALPVSRLPRLTDLQTGALDLPALDARPIAIEDLLGRPQAALDRPAMRDLIAGRRVLITGAGGSIGSELVRQIAAAGPAHLVLLDSAEFALYQIDLEAGERWPDLSRAAVLGDVRDAARLETIFTTARPELVFHAAALKHVPIAETNPAEAILTNAIGTRNVADLAARHGVAAMVMISTDKAVNPTNVMGATKRLAEAYAQARDLARAGGAGTRYVTVRFGNVLGSTGSVVPLFQRQLARGGPLTVTHPDINRYFMTIREAVELVLQASVLGMEQDHQAGRIFVLDMGEPVRITHLAEQIIRLSGKRPYRDINIIFTGLRPGEKLYEELFHAAEPLIDSRVPAIKLAAPRPLDLIQAARDLAELEALCHHAPADAALARLGTLVPEFSRQGD